MSTLRLIPVTGNPVEVTQDAVLLGRDPGCEIVLTDGSVSRKHARVERRGESWFVVDQGSANGTFVDGGRVTESALKHGQELRLGAVLHRVEILSADSGATVLTELDPATVRQAVAATTPAPQAPPPPPPLRAAPPPPPRFAPKPLLTAEPPLTQGTPKGRGPWVWIGGGCCGCLLLIMLAAGAVVGYGWKQSAGAFGVVQEMVSDLKRGDQRAAFGRFGRAYQEQMSLEQFGGIVEAHPGLARNAAVTKEGWHGGTGGTQVTVLLTAESGERERGVFDLVKEDGQWRIASFEIEGVSSSP